MTKEELKEIDSRIDSIMTFFAQHFVTLKQQVANVEGKLDKILKALEQKKHD